MVSIPACHAGDPGSIPGNGVTSFLIYIFIFRKLRESVASFLLAGLWTELSTAAFVLWGFSFLASLSLSLSLSLFTNITSASEGFSISDQAMGADEADRVFPFQLQFDKHIASQVYVSLFNIRLLSCAFISLFFGGTMLLVFVCGDPWVSCFVELKKQRELFSALNISWFANGRLKFPSGNRKGFASHGHRRLGSFAPPWRRLRTISPGELYVSLISSA